MSAIQKVRMILLGTMGITAGLIGFIMTNFPLFAEYDIAQLNIAVPSYFFAIGLAFMCLAALFVFLFSFANIAVTPDGAFCYNPKNFWWRCIKKIGGANEKIGFCKAYWLTVLVIFLGFFLTFAISVLSFALYFVWYSSGIAVGWNELIPILQVFGVLGGVGAYLFLFSVTENHRVIQLLLISLFVGGLIALAYVVKGGSEALELFIICFVMAIGFLVVLFVQEKLIPLLKKTWMWSLFANFHKNTCPTLVECPLPPR